MRLAHLADLHLGRVFHANSLVEDQAYALAQVLDVLRRDGVDAVLLAGDLYDRALPGREAVRLLDWFLREVNESLGLPVVAIAGNHDSADHLGFGAWMFRRENLHVRGRMDPAAAPVRFADAHGPIDVYPLPYVEPEAAREWLVAAGDADAAGSVTHRDTVRAMLRHARSQRAERPGVRAVTLCHAFVEGDRHPDESPRSERSLYLGGVGAALARDFEGFAYTALGHLHRPQSLTADGGVRYSGSLLKYAFDEVDHDKGFTVVDLDAEGRCRVEHRSITPRRDLARIAGELESLLHRDDLTPMEGCFVSAEITDHPPPLQAMERLRARFPYAAELRFRALELELPALDGLDAHRTARDPAEVFEAFFARETGAPPDDSQRAVFHEALLAAREGEAS
ncbi:MAG: exonuclease SbcCD subunit D [Polyangiales bacterium]